jgi:hypothetical protein
LYCHCGLWEFGAGGLTSRRHEQLSHENTYGVGKL